jgi:phosphatidate cytidylyltransferase
MNAVMIRALGVTELLFFVGLVFIVFIGIRKKLSIEQKKALWGKFGTYLLIVNVYLMLLMTNEYLYCSLVLILSICAVRELAGIAALKQIDVNRAFLFCISTGLFAVAVFNGISKYYTFTFLALIFALAIPVLKRDPINVFEKQSATILVLLYGSVVPTYLVFVYESENGMRLAAYLFLMITMNDGFSELFGRSLGKRSIWPTISPNKTWMGSIGGLLSTVVGSIMFKFLIPDISIAQAIAIAILIGVSGQLGDLIASAFKRDVKIKDFGNLIPYHGGVLDRFDSLFFAAPVFYYASKLILTH